MKRGLKMLHLVTDLEVSTNSWSFIFQIMPKRNQQNSICLILKSIFIDLRESLKETVQVFLSRAFTEVTDLGTMLKFILTKGVRKLFEFKRLQEVSYCDSSWKMISETCSSIPMKNIWWCPMYNSERELPLEEYSRPWWSTTSRKRPWDEGLLQLRRSRLITEWDMKRIPVSSTLFNWVNTPGSTSWKSKSPFS